MLKFNKKGLKEAALLVFIPVFIGWLLFFIIKNIDSRILTNNIKNFFRLSNFQILTGSLKTAFFNLKSFLWFFIILTVAFYFGKLILNKFKISLTLAEKAVYSAALGFAFLAYVMLFAGLTGTLYSLWIKIILIILFAVSLKRIKFPKINFLKFLKKLKSKTNIYQKIILLTLVPAVLLNLIMILSPEIFYDSLVYHLAVPNYYIIHNSIKPVEYIAHSNFPSNQQMLNMLALLADSELTAKAVHMFMLFSIYILVFLAVKKIFGLNTAFYALALTVSFSALSVNAWTCGNDAALTFYFCAALSAGLNYIKNKNIHFLFLSFLFAGTALAVKYTAVFAVSGLILPLFFYFIFTKSKKSEEAAEGKSKVGICLILIVLIIIPVTPWLVKNYAFTSNPFHPFFYGFFSDNELRDFSGSGLTPLPLNISSLNFKKIFTPLWDKEAASGNLDLFFAVFLPALLFLKFKNKFVLILTASFLTAYFLWFFGALNLRFLIPALIILIIIIAEGFKNFTEKFKIFSLALPLIIILNFFYFNYNFFRGMGTGFYLKGNLSKDAYLSLPKAIYPVPPYAAIKWAGKNLAGGSKILFIGESRSHYIKHDYICYSAEINRQPLIEYLKISETAEDFYFLLKQKGITHFLINYKEAVRVEKAYNHFYWTEKERKIFDGFWKKHIKLLYFKNGSYIYNIKENLNSSAKPSPNVLEKLARRGWSNENLSKIYYENKMYDSLIDDMKIYMSLGRNLTENIKHIQKLKEEENEFNAAEKSYQ